MENIYYTKSTSADFQDILDLQEQNSKASLSEKELKNDGFVTLKHSIDLLRKMNDPYPHIIAKNNDNVIGYALVLLTRLRNDLKGLDNMFEQFMDLSYQGKNLYEHKFFIMGQICIAKSFRGKGVFRGIYECMAFNMKEDFDLIVTEIDEKNQRSLNAHIGVGFEIIRKYSWPNGKSWNIVALKIR